MAADNRSNPVWRILTLLPYLQTHPGVAVDEAAREFAISPAQLRRELTMLWLDVGTGFGGGELVDVDMDAVDEEGRIYVSNADYLTRPMRLTPDEATSLVVALRAVEEMASGEFAEAVRSALDKLTTLMAKERPRIEVSVVGGGEDVRACIGQAIAEHRRVRLTYEAASDEITTPTVDPERIHVRDGVAYLDAFSLDRGAWRTYRLERIASVEVLEEAAETHETPQRERGWFVNLGPDAEVTMILRPEAAWVSEYFPMRRVERLADGRVEVAFVVADPVWFTRLLLRLGEGVEKVEPPEVVDAAREMAQLALNRYHSVFVTAASGD